MAAGCHNYFVIFFGSCNSAFFTAPTHYNGIWRQPAFQNFIPTYQGSALAIKVFFHTLDKITLQLMLIFEFIIFYTLLALGTTLPICLGAFIAPHMNVLRR